MFLKSLKIATPTKFIRKIEFKLGLNLIVDDTPNSTNSKSTGNIVGKTTVLALIDYCLGDSGKNIYSDNENPKGINTVVKEFLEKEKIIITLTLTTDLNNPLASQVVIERNFLHNKNSLQKINGNDITASEFRKNSKNISFQTKLQKSLPLDK